MAWNVTSNLFTRDSKTATIIRQRDELGDKHMQFLIGFPCTVIDQLISIDPYCSKAGVSILNLNLKNLFQLHVDFASN